MMNHPWHDIFLGDPISNGFSCVIEIPKGSKNKYELDKTSGLLRLDRVLHSAVHYPANYGFLPQTYCDDEDPLDVLVLSQESFAPLCIVEGRAIGMMTMSDDKGKDDKIIAVAVQDPEYNHFYDISELPEHKLRELKRFFLDYKILENKKVVVDNMQNHQVAEKIIEDAVQLYRKEILGTRLIG